MEVGFTVEQKVYKHDDLKKCPFCNSEAMIRESKQKLILNEIVTCYSVICSHCHCETRFCKTEEEAISNWNKRSEQLSAA